MVKRTTTKTAKVSDNAYLPYIIVNPHTHEDWLSERYNGIGASECGKIIGCSKYGSVYQLWRDKLGLNPPIEENWAMISGHIYEDYVAQLFQKELGFKVIKNSTGDWLAVNREKPYLRVSPDRLYWLKGDDGKDKPHNITNRGILECKTSVHHFTPECLQGECLSWFCQVQYQLHVMGLKEAYLGFLCVDSLSGGEHWFERIQYDEKFCNSILIPSITTFWLTKVKPAKELISLHNGTIFPELMEQINEFAPAITEADDVSKRYPRQDDDKKVSLTDVTSEFYDNFSIYLQLRDQRKKIDDEMKSFEENTKLLLLDADSLVGDDGKPLITYRQNKPSSKFDAAKFKVENPELYEQYCKVVPGNRVLKIK